MEKKKAVLDKEEEAKTPGPWAQKKRNDINGVFPYRSTLEKR